MNARWWYVVAASLVLLSLALFTYPRGERTGQSPEDAEHLARPTNKPIEFYGLAVDQDGVPLAGVEFELTAVATSGNVFRGEQKSVPTVHKVKTDSSGKLSLSETGESLQISATLAGYRLLGDLYAGTDRNGRIRYNEDILYWNWSDAEYFGDPTNPAIYVFVKDGVTAVRAKMSRGGMQRRGVPLPPGATPFWANEPGFPVKPSIEGLTFEGN